MNHTAELCIGRVMHARLRPVIHQFSYGVFFLRVPLSILSSIENRWTSLNRFNLLSLYESDYGPRDGSDLLSWAQSLLAANDITAADGEIVLQTFPRLFGYVFNPISIFYCYDTSGAMRAAICEVSNTFGERHHYLVAHNDARPIVVSDWLYARKALHVSPFCEVRGVYRFCFEQGLSRAFAQIDYFDNGAEHDKLIVTTLYGSAEPLNSRRAIVALLRFPLMTVGVVARIHWQAFKLWKKRVPFFGKPAPPAQPTTKSLPSISTATD